MNRDMTNLNIGDYISDRNNVSWRVDKVTNEEYIVTEPLENITITISRKTPSIWEKGNFAKDYRLVRPCGHEEITKYPIGSRWICTDKSGLNDPKKDTVIIRHYGYDEGMFWVCNINKQYILFLARYWDLKPIDVKNKKEK